jgi:preprotein translocase subunit SecF
MQLIKETNIDFMKWRNQALLASLIVIGIGIASLIVKGGPNYGIDFSGGTVVDVCIKEKRVDIGDVRKSLREIIPAGSTIQHLKEMGGTDQTTCPGGSEILIRTLMEEQEGKTEEELEREMEATSAQIEQRLREKFGEIEVIGREMVGPQVGHELRTSAILAIVGALIGILIYISFRFQFRFAVGAIVALVHDVLVTLGMFSLFNREINLPVVGALLTIVGYSLNDTIVVFDRIRENISRRSSKRQRYIDLINRSLNETLSRTLLTSLTTLIVVLCLFVLGGRVINDFAFALLVGVIVGTYSSIWVASSLIVWWFGPEATPGKQRGRR